VKRDLVSGEGPNHLREKTGTGQPCAGIPKSGEKKSFWAQCLRKAAGRGTKVIGSSEDEACEERRREEELDGMASKGRRMKEIP